MPPPPPHDLGVWWSLTEMRTFFTCSPALWTFFFSSSPLSCQRGLWCTMGTPTLCLENWAKKCWGRGGGGGGWSYMFWMWSACYIKWIHEYGCIYRMVTIKSVQFLETKFNWYQQMDYVLNWDCVYILEIKRVDTSIINVYTCIWLLWNIVYEPSNFFSCNLIFVEGD